MPFSGKKKINACSGEKSRSAEKTGDEKREKKGKESGQGTQVSRFQKRGDRLSLLTSCHIERA